jgi:hypothetical protein
VLPTVNADCANGNGDRRSEICAQWKAADAAQESAVWAGRTFWLGIFGVLGGFLTLGAATAAAWYAKRAAEYTRAGALEAKRAADAAEIDLRPWISVSVHPNFAVTSSSGSLTISLIITMKNVGRTPAQNVRYEAEPIEGGKYGADHEFFHNPHAGKDWPRPCQAIFPGGEFSDQELVWVPWSEEQRVRGITPLLGVNVTYDLPGGKSGQTSTSYDIGCMIEGDDDRLGGIRHVEGSLGPGEGELKARQAWFARFT